jgi:phage tail-like protein
MAAADYFDDGYPPPAFYFTVTFGNGQKVADTAFTEVSGIATEFEMEPLTEGGENRFVHQLPTKIKHGNLEMKRGIAKKMSPLVAWCKETLEGELAKRIETQTIIVKLTGNKGQVLRGWKFNNAYPVKWSVDGFNSTKNEVAVESISFAYTYSERIV